jgi:probable phosphomutase (TIGR03848 family)
MMTMMNLLLIRHAANDWVGERLAGWTSGVHLNDKGRAQADSLAKRLSETPLAAIFCSPLERALETAQPLAQARGLSIEVRDSLGEISYGEWTGRSLKELQQEELWPVIQVHPSGVRFPRGESMHEVQSRMVAEIDAIRDAYQGQTVAVISHADPIKAAVAYYAGLSLDLFQRLIISPASVTAFAFTRWGPRLIFTNHTEELPSFKIEKENENEEQ